MSLFKKSGVDVLDFTKLQKKGILKVAEKKNESTIKVNSQGYVDFGLSSLPSSDSATSENASSNSNFGSEGSGTSALGFLDSLASSSGTNSSSSQNTGNYFGSSSGSDPLELQGLKNKIDDLEYKLRSLEDKIAKIENKN